MATDGTSKKPAEHVGELKDLIVGYAKQEAWDPVATLGRYMLWGMTGAIAVGLGCIFLLLAMLRGLESLDAFDGTGAMSLIPYAATLVLAVVMIVLAALRITKDYQKESRS